MITSNRMADVAPGKMGNAVAFAHEICTYMKSAHKLDLEVLLPIGGNPQRIAWSTHDADLAALDKVSSGILTDKKY